MRFGGLSLSEEQVLVNQPPSLDKETSSPIGRRIWSVTLGVTALLVLLGIIFLLVAHHIGLPK